MTGFLSLAAAVDWHILVPDLSLVEKAVRSAVVYIFLVVAFRVAGKRELGLITPFDLVVLMILSNALQNSLIGNDNSLGGGLVSAVVLFVLNRILCWLSIRFPAFGRLVEGEPTLLVRDGEVLEANLKREMMTRRELERAIRKHDLDPENDLPRVRVVLLETDGSVTVLHETTAGGPRAAASSS